jgi:shikimate kinase
VKRQIALVGFMASGKSTVGRRVARALSLPFIDTDSLVVETAGPIDRIFAERGERAFRELERAAVERALAGEQSVIALGGGALTFEPTRLLVAEHAHRVYLHASAETIVTRVRRSRTLRPLLGKTPTIERVRELLAGREGHYREAEVVVGVDGRRIEAVARDVVRQLAGDPVQERS